MMSSFNGLGMHLGNLSRLSDAETRSICGENPTGEPGKGAMAPPPEKGGAAELGEGWKCRAWVPVEPFGRLTLAEIDGPGAIQSIWIAGSCVRDQLRETILRIWWDGQEQPSVEVPLRDFFAQAWGPYAPVHSLPVVVGPGSGMNCFWEMPFRKHCRIEIENRSEKRHAVYWQINYTLTDIPEDAAYFHAQFGRTNPVPYKEPYTIVDGIEGRGHYVGTVLHVGLNGANRWWGEGEIKFFMDDDDKYPTICGTGTEDYFGGSYDWHVDGHYQPYTTPYFGMHQVIVPNDSYESQQRFAMYRWHVMDPVRFKKRLSVTIQDLGHRRRGGFLPRQDDFSSVAYWYQALPTAPFPDLPDRDYLEIT